jgi:predicted secreted protein
MGFLSGILVYICLWWVIFFMTLPFGVSQDNTPQKGHDLGAPKKPYICIKMAITAVLAALGWLLINYLLST